MESNFDAIVVGSGISGGWAAKELCEKGLRVLMLERGQPVNHPDYPTASLDPWQLPHAGRLTAEDKNRCPVQSRHFSYRGDNKQYYINDLENPYTEVKRFDWIRGDIVGGRSLLWGRQCYRWSDLDFEANLRDGIAVDWPIRYRDLEPWYTYVEKITGISGQAENIPHLPDSAFLPPMEMNCVEKHFKQSVEAKFPGRYVTIGRVANNTAPVQGRGTCQYRNQCHRGCPYGAYFSTNASTLPAAHATGKLTLLTGVLVTRVNYDPVRSRATGVDVVDMATGKTNTYSASIVFLNASTVATAQILLNSTSERFPNGLGNDSDQVGRNLMDHHKGAGASALVEGFEDQYYSGRRPNGLYIPRYRNLSDKRKDYIRGFGFQGGASREGWQSHQTSNLMGTELKHAIQSPGPWRIGFGGFGECLPYAENRVTLDEKKDKFGRPLVKVDCAFKDNERTMQKDMAASMAEMLESAGYRQVKANMEISFPGNANHEMGTARMGRDPRTSVLNSFNQVHAVRNVFITDGACMTSSSCVNPSLTYMALTARACDFAVRELKRKNL